MTEAKCGRRTNKKLHHGSATLVLRWIAVLLLASLWLPEASASTILPSRINGPIRSGQKQIVKGTVSPRVGAARDEGELAGSAPIENMSLVFALSQRNGGFEKPAAATANAGFPAVSPMAEAGAICGALRSQPAGPSESGVMAALAGFYGDRDSGER